MLAQATWKEQAVILTFFIAAINAPISWKKAQLGHSITWCGWTFHSDIEALRLVAGKLAKLRDQLEKLARSKKFRSGIHSEPAQARCFTHPTVSQATWGPQARYTCAMKAGRHCAGSPPASTTTSFALSDSLHFSTAMAAADAMAKGDTGGIGGWITAASNFFWFSEPWSMTGVRLLWPELSKTTQGYIACRETLAQLALAMLAHRKLHSRHFKFGLPTASDNTSTEAGIDKLFTTTEPINQFLKRGSSWSARRNIQLAVSHLAGFALGRREERLGRRAQQIQTAPLCQTHSRQRTLLSGHAFLPTRRSYTAPAACSMGTGTPGRTASRMSPKKELCLTLGTALLKHPTRFLALSDTCCRYSPL